MIVACQHSLHIVDACFQGQTQHLVRSIHIQVNTLQNSATFVLAAHMKSSECTLHLSTKELQVLQLSTASEQNVLEGCLQIRSLFLGKLKSTLEQSPYTAFITLKHYVHILDLLYGCYKEESFGLFGCLLERWSMGSICSCK